MLNTRLSTILREITWPGEGCLWKMIANLAFHVERGLFLPKIMNKEGIYSHNVYQPL